MPWQNNSGGPWGGGGGGGGGGRGPWGGGNGGGGGNNRPPDIDDLLRQGRDKLRVIIGGGGGGGGGGGLPPIGKRGYAFIAAALVGLWVLTGLYSVRPEEQSVELLFGEFYASRGPGLQFAPWPFVTYEKMAVTRENVVNIGTDTGRNRGTGAAEGLMLTGDENIVDIEYQVVWNVSDLRNFLFNIVNPEETVRAVSESAMREVIGRSELSPILNRDRAIVAQDVLASIRSTLEAYESGVNVLRVNFDRADPPGPVIDAFRDVQAAAQDRQTAENQAEAYANRALAEARGQSAQMLQEAEAYRVQTVNEAAGEAARFTSILAEYANAPDVTRQRLYLETMERVLGSVDKFIIDEQAGGQSGVLPYLPLNEIRRAQR